MALSSGQNLTHYRIQDRLGAGAMGEVYRARDTRLERDVAIKVLPEALADDEERLRRFEREAKTLASLNHPNLAHVYGIDQVDDTCFIAMELVPGEDLGATLARGPLPLEDALEICRQIAEGLEAAHEAGVVHRDLKPANVRLTSDGVVKILDFGLAKPMGPGRSGDGSRKAEEDSFLVTEEGLILGTPTYMSPEQARGKPVDRRTDVWAFGCLLYECLTGRRAFVGKSLTDVLAAIVQEEPDYGALPESTPRSVARLIERCLHKKPRQRLRDIGEARVLLEKPDSESREPVEARGGPGVTGLVVLALAALAIGALVGKNLGGPETGPPALTRFTLDHRVADQGTWGGNLVAISPDGRTIAYVGVPGDSRLHVRQLSAFEARAVPETEGAYSPFFSPDGERIAFWADGKLKRVSVTGGAPGVIASSQRLGKSSWGPDDRIVATELGQFVRIDARTGESTALTDDSSDFVDAPSFLPGGEVVLFDKDYELATMRVADGEWQLLGQRGKTPRWSATGHIVYQAEDSTLWAVAFDPDRLEITGKPHQLLERTVLDHAVADDGTLVYVPGLGRAMELVWVDRAGEATPLDQAQGHYLIPRLSPVDRSVAVSLQEGSGELTDLWVLDLTRGTRTRLTTDGDWNLWPVWTHGASRLCYMGDGYLWTRAADGSDEPRNLTDTGERNEVPISWSEPDQALAFYSFNEGGGDLRIWHADGGVEDFLVTRFDERSPQFSPDGRWIAYVSDQSGVSEVYVRSYARGQGPGTRVAVSTGGGGEPRWSRDGSELFYRKGSQMFVVSFESGEPGEPGPSIGAPNLLFDGPYLGSPIGRGNPNYDVALDGRFLMVRVTDTADMRTPTVHVVRGLSGLLPR